VLTNPDGLHSFTRPVLCSLILTGCTHFALHWLHFPVRFQLKRDRFIPHGRSSNAPTAICPSAPHQRPPQTDNYTQQYSQRQAAESSALLYSFVENLLKYTTSFASNSFSIGRVMNVTGDRTSLHYWRRLFFGKTTHRLFELYYVLILNRLPILHSCVI
jgi:hypothetical protein